MWLGVGTTDLQRNHSWPTWWDNLSLDKRRAAEVYLNFSRVFNTVSHNSVVEKLMKNGLDKWAMKWVEKWLNCQDYMTAAPSPAENQSLMAYLKALSWYQYPLTTSLMTWMVEQSTPSAGLQVMQNWEDWNTRWGCCCSERPWKANKWYNMNILESGNELCRKGAEDTIAQRSPVLSWIKLGRALLPGPSREVYSPVLRMGETKSGRLYSVLGSTAQHRCWHTEASMKVIILCSRLLRKVGESVFLESFQT